MSIKITRKWAMPNSLTFSIKPIAELIERYHNPSKKWIDPFCRENPYKAITNDLNPDVTADYHMEALEFLNMFDDCSLDGVFFDPPYTPRQVKECYDGIGIPMIEGHTNALFWTDRKNKIAEILNVGGICISACWNTNGLGINRGFELVEILLVAHGGPKNDTIVTVERKTHHQLRLF
jgi:hypothetical protein